MSYLGIGWEPVRPGGGRARRNVGLRFASSITTQTDAAEAVEELIRPVDESMTVGMVDLALLFATAHYTRDMEGVLERLTETFPGAALIGCTVCGAIGVNAEIEKGPSMSLWAAELPDVRLYPFSFQQEQLEVSSGHLDWERMVGVAPESRPAFLALVDPFRLDTLGFLEQINGFFPGASLIGGIASGARQPGQNLLFVNGEVHNEGVVGVAFTGDLAVDTVVSQGCRPIGEPFVVTKGQQNIILELGGHPPLARLDAVFSRLSPRDKSLVRPPLLLGRAIDEYKTEFARGDFLVQGISGVDRRSGALVIAGPVRVGSTVQFHVRDAASADEDLREALAPHADAGARAALLFSCNGRGTQMWPDPGHDIGLIREVIGRIPVAGMFCGGEFGPVGGKNFVHGFTASIALFRPRHEQADRP
jgi:small ligand-binding sensory domain FIST